MENIGIQPYICIYTPTLFMIIYDWMMDFIPNNGFFILNWLKMFPPIKKKHYLCTRNLKQEEDEEII